MGKPPRVRGKGRAHPSFFFAARHITFFLPEQSGRRAYSERGCIVSKRLSDRPSLEQLKKQARDLQKAHNSGAADTAARLRKYLPRSAGPEPADTAVIRLSLRDAQQVIAREYGFGSWQKLKEHVQEETGLFDVLFKCVEARPQEVARVARAWFDTPDALGGLMVALGQTRTALVMKYLSDAEIEKTVQAIGSLGAVDEEDKHKALAALENRLAADEPVVDVSVPDHSNFILGALEQAVGQKRAREMMARQGLVAGESTGGSTAQLGTEYLQEKDAFIRHLQKKPTHELDLDEIRRVVVGLAEIARAEGILALEQILEDKAQLDPLLRYGIQLAVDGTEPHVLEEMLNTRAQTLVQELDTRCRMIVAGVRAIHNDENPRIVDQRLASFYQKSSD